MEGFQPQKRHQQHMRGTAPCPRSQHVSPVPTQQQRKRSKFGLSPILGRLRVLNPSPALGSRKNPNLPSPESSGGRKSCKIRAEMGDSGWRRGFGEGDGKSPSQRDPQSPNAPSQPGKNFGVSWATQTCQDLSSPRPEGDFSFPQGQPASGKIRKCPHGVRARQ